MEHVPPAHRRRYDVVLLTPMLVTVPDFANWHTVTEVLHRWHWARKPLTATINILSIALYDLFGADGMLCGFIYYKLCLLTHGTIDQYLAVLRNGCFKYFERGGECICGPVSLLSSECFPGFW